MIHFFRRLFLNPNRNGAILTGDEIKRQIKKGRIRISGYIPENMNPNSYNICCGRTVRVYKDIGIIDLKNKDTFSEVETFDIDPDEGFILRPGMLYLIPTREYIQTDYFEPIITGRSSIGRLGISIHQEAGFGDIGFAGVMTMQLKVTYPTRIYPFMPIAQIYFLTPRGKIATLYNGKYKWANYAVPSRLGD